MNYTISPVLGGNIDKKGTYKIYFRIIYERKKIEVPTSIRIPADNFENGKVIKHKSKVLFNNILAEDLHRLNGLLLEFRNRSVSKDELKATLLGRTPAEENNELTTVVDFMYDTCDKKLGKWSLGYIEQIHAIANKISRFAPDFLLQDVSVMWLQSFERFIRNTGVNNNTISVNMRNLKIVLRIAEREEIITSKQFEPYKPPVEIKKIHTFLTNEEIDRFEEAMWSFNSESHTTAGMYFLFTCRTGFRISDAKKFNYNKMVLRDTIVLQAKKNKSVVSIPLYPALNKIIDWVKDNKFDMSEVWGNNRLEQIAEKAKIDKHVTFHVGRHTFAQGLSDKGFTEDEIAAQLGDSKDIARRYATVSNARLEKRYRELMF